MRKSIIGIIAVASTFALASCSTAQESKTSAPSSTGMMHGMNGDMGDMEKRMGGMHQMMQQCMATDKACPMDKMMADMQAMHAQMDKMMAKMKMMHKSGQPMATEKEAPKDKSEDHEEHHN